MRALQCLGCLALFLPLASSVASCGASNSTPADERPPRICKPAAQPRALPWFTEVTGDVGLGKTPDLEPLAGNVISADFDGDGWADLLVMSGSAARGPRTAGDFAGKRGRFLFLNRPDAKDAKKRVFVESLAQSGLLATRDGKGDRGFNIATAADLDNDGDVDLLLCSADELSDTYSPLDACAAFQNDGKAHFSLAKESDLDGKIAWYPSLTLLDYDRDGNVDFWPATIAYWPYDPLGPNREPPTLYRGNGDGTFANVSRDVGLPTQPGTLAAATQWRHVFGVTACDLDGDGDDDMLFASYGREECQAWRNDDGHFVNVARDWGLDEDDRLDFSDDQSYRCYCKVNAGTCPATVPAPAPASFCDAFGNGMGRGWGPDSERRYSLGGNYFSFACGDVDNDGDMDLMSATIVHGDTGSASDPSELILNPGDGSKFVRPGNETNGLYRPEKGIMWNHGDSQASFVDFDLDGLKDMFITTTGAYGAIDHAHLWHQTPDHRWEQIIEAAGLVAQNVPNHQSPSFIDIDGDLDIVVGDSAKPVLRAYRNDIGQDQNWLRVRLVGKGAGGSNKSAIGAVVCVTAGGQTITEYVNGGHAIGTILSDHVLTFGLGAACDIDRVEVRWPNAQGTTATYKDVRANYEVQIVEGARSVTYPRVPVPSSPAGEKK